MKKKIETRDDVSKLVHSFYDKIRKDKEIGHFFNDTIQDWNEHLEKLTDFWENNLFAVRKYYGNPIAAHTKVDRLFNKSITMEHFGIWLNYWFETLDELFEGDNVVILKRRARKIGTVMYMNIYESRQT